MSVRVTQVSRINCNHDLYPCGEAVESIGDASRVRWVAREKGWQVGRRGARDYCPKHRTGNKP